MSPEQQRIAIAQVCGWTNINIQCSNINCGTPPSSKIGPAICLEGIWHYTLPDYLSDLNAMHEAEKILSDEQRYNYMLTLAEITKTTQFRNLISSTAAQRAKAFLKTLNLWTS
jgi:hypothetical protein